MTDCVRKGLYALVAFLARADIDLTYMVWKPALSAHQGFHRS